MRIVAVDPERPAAETLERAAEVIRAGGLVAFPTETVYGLGADALAPAAVARIFAAKGRPSFNPLIAHVDGIAGARRLTTGWPTAAQRLAESFWPGPLTLVLPKRRDIPDVVTAGLPTVALRVPAHPVALALLGACGVPLAAPSANRYTAVSPTTAEHVARGLGGRVDLILDGGPTRVGIESTVLDLSGREPVLLRPGSIPLPALEEVAGPIRRGAPIGGEEARPSPGMVARHYSPTAQLRIFEAGEREEMAAAARRAARAGQRVGALLLRPLDAPVDLPIPMPADPESYASRLYAALHDLDQAGCALIVADAVPTSAAWDGVRDRLTRAAHRG